MKKKKLKLEELKIQSFITELKPAHAETAKGGSIPITTVLFYTPEINEAIIFSIEACEDIYDGFKYYWDYGVDNSYWGDNCNNITMYIELPTVVIHG